MRKTSAEILDYYDEEVVKMISEKYNLEQMKALREYLLYDDRFRIGDVGVWSKCNI